MEFNETVHYEHGGFMHGDWRRHSKYAGSQLLEKCCHDMDLAHWILGSLPMRVASFGGLDFFRPEYASYVAKLGPHPKNGRPAFSSWPRPEEHSPFCADKDIIDNQVAILEFANGARATFHHNCLTNLRERRMYICGTDGTLRGDVITGELEYNFIRHDAEPHKTNTGGKGGHGQGDPTLSASLRESIINGAPPLSSVDDGLASAMTCFAIDRAMETGQVVDLRGMWAEAGIDP
jgi:predicted dehydrogenase